MKCPEPTNNLPKFSGTPWNVPETLWNPPDPSDVPWYGLETSWPSETHWNKQTQTPVKPWETPLPPETPRNAPENLLSPPEVKPETPLRNIETPSNVSENSRSTLEISSWNAPGKSNPLNFPENLRDPLKPLWNPPENLLRPPEAKQVTSGTIGTSRRTALGS